MSLAGVLVCGVGLPVSLAATVMDKLQVRSSEVILVRDHMYVEIAASVPGWGGNEE